MLQPDKAIRVLLVEINPTMHASQKANIRNVNRTNLQVHCILPCSSEYTMLVAHEFFNAIPIRVLLVIQVFRIYEMKFVLIYRENQ